MSAKVKKKDDFYIVSLSSPFRLVQRETDQQAGLEQQDQHC
jgi:hypothetical protein